MTPRTHRPLVALALVSVALFAACSNGSGGGAPSTAATIDGTKITDAQLAHSVKLFSFLGSLNQNACGSAKVAGETQAAACARFSLGSLIQEHFIATYAQQHHITVAQKDVDAIITQLETSLGSAAALDAKLKESQITRADLDELAHRILLFQAVQRDIGSASPDEAALQKLYHDNILQFTTLDTEHILVKTQAQANDIYAQVTAPGFTEKDFLALAKKVSTDPTVPQNSGALGPIPASQLEQPYAEAAAALKPGEISRPVQSSFGWHVIRSVSTKVQPFAQARATLVQQQATQTFDAWLQKAVAAATITVNPRYGVFNETTQSVDAVTSTASGSATPAASGSATPVNATPTASP